MAEIDIDRVIGISKNVATDYLIKGQDLNQSIAKIASDSGLNGEQIQRVVETTNHIVYQYLYKKATDDKNIVFTLADAEKVANEMSTERVKLAEQTLAPAAEEHVTSSDFAYGPGWSKVAEPEPQKVEVPSTNKEAYEAMAKSAEEFRQAEYLPRFATLIKSAMVEGSAFEADPKFIDKYLTICKLAKDISGDKWDKMQPVIEKVASHYYHTGFFSGDDIHKLANALVGNDSLPSLPASKVVNGDHILIKTVREYIQVPSDYTGAYPKEMGLRDKDVAES